MFPLQCVIIVQLLLFTLVTCAGLSYKYNTTVPFLASILDRKMHVCCGTVLNYRTLLTTAYCLDSPSPLHLMVNVTRCNIDTPEEERDSFDIITKFVHPKYKRESFTDIAVVHTDRSMREKDVVPAKLLGRSLEVGDNVSVYGWNYDFYLDFYGEQLFVANTTVIDPLKCVHHYGSRFLYDQMLCLDMWRYAEPSFDPLGCEMDPSSAAVIEENGTFYIGGMALFTGGCMFSGWPAVFVNTYSYNLWIKEQIYKNKETIF